jgi:hypothetical protein
MEVKVDEQSRTNIKLTPMLRISMTASVACLVLGNWAIATCEGMMGAGVLSLIPHLDVTYVKTNGEFVELTLRDNAERAIRANEQFCYVKAS